MSNEPKCNRDCFNCIFKDCIVDGVLPGERKEMKRRDDLYTTIKVVRAHSSKAKTRRYRDAGLDNRRSQ